MQAFVSQILSVVIFIQCLGFNLNDLAQLDDFWSHYQEHKLENGDDFLTFLDLHYGSEHENHKDEHPEHQDLPMQHVFYTHFTFFVNEKTSINLGFVDHTDSIQHNFGYNAIFTSLLETDILQPPRSFV